MYWAMIFLKRIYHSGKYMRAAFRNVSDESSAYFTSQLLYHYHTEIRKYVLLVAILIMEITASVSFYSHLLIEN